VKDYYNSSCIDLSIPDWQKCEIITNPTLQEKATKDRPLVAIILWIKVLPKYLYQ
jgi:hypothetical protein